MFSIFKSVSSIAQGVQLFPQWTYIRSGLQRNLKTIVKFHRENPMAVKSDHFLVTLLNSISIPMAQNLERYYDNVDALALNMSMALKMTSSIFKGQLFNGIFYGQGNTEILIANNDSFDIYKAHRGWENLCPVKVLRHPRSDLGLHIPNGTNAGSENGLVVITVNIPLLAVMYRAFRLNEMALEEADPTNVVQRTVMQFVYMYVLPNMLFSHMDQSLFNRADHIQRGIPMGEARRVHSYYLTDYSVAVDSAFTSLLINLYDVNKSFTGMMRTLPMVVKDNMEGAMLLPDIAPTRQVLWALVISRLNVIAFLFKATKSGANGMNQSETNMMLKSIRAYQSDNLFRSMLPAPLFAEIQEQMESLASQVKL